jgi:predicted transcriptional regulator
MKKAVNLRLDENIIITLEQLSKELHTTKTDIIEKSIKLFSQDNKKSQNNLLQFAGTLNSTDSEEILKAIKEDKNSKDFSLDF